MTNMYKLAKLVSSMGTARGESLHIHEKVSLVLKTFTTKS